MEKPTVRNNKNHKYILRELVDMRTKPTLGFIPKRNDLDIYVGDFHYTAKNVQFENIGSDSSEIIEIGKSLIFHSDHDGFIKRCMDLLRLPAEDKDAKIRLMLILDLYSEHTQLQISMAAISMAYDGTYLLHKYNMFENRLKYSDPVWNWEDPIDNYINVDIRKDKIFAIVLADATCEKNIMKKEEIRSYSMQTMQLFLKNYTEHALLSRTVKEYIDDYLDVHAPIGVIAFIKNCKGCVECAIASSVNRKCTQHPLAIQILSIINNNNTITDVYLIPPQPSAPPEHLM